MNSIHRVTVLPRLPQAIARLRELAYNLWWSWEPDAQNLYSMIDPDTWEWVNHNPVKFLHHVSQSALERAAASNDYLQHYEQVLEAFDGYMDPSAPTWWSANHSGSNGDLIAYFSAEFGLHEALPIYSGGLGVLSGDHCKCASDLGLPFIGVGFLYPQGYFTQHLSENGSQEAVYEKMDFAEVPATPAQDPNGNEVLINVDLPGRTIYAKVWRIQVGRIPIFLMDTDVPRNAPADRELSARLYGGDREMRISQEVVLGIGGVRAVRALGYQPTVWHMNEGHSAFSVLERVRELTQDSGLAFAEAVEVVRANTLFTTHTPVPAGNDAFAFEMVDKYFSQYWGQLGIDRDRFMALASQDSGWGAQYGMTVLALRASAYANGVSRLHGEVSREMWQNLWPGTPVSEVPIGYITNGVHTKTWLVPELRRLFREYFGEEWEQNFDDPDQWAVDRVPDAELWTDHIERKQRMVAFVRGRLRAQALRHGEGPRFVADVSNVLDPDALTLGFARRFATYKRATLIFTDLERLHKLLWDSERPVQLVFAGKAHPADAPGQSFIQRIYELSLTPEFFGKIVFVEDYDMNMSRHLVSGVDVWLNNPRRPLEASGTSGQKAAANAVPNFSALDGWWDEGFDGSNGWAIGESRSYKDDATQDEADALSLYATLEDEIIPLYYERDTNGVPRGWISTMKNAVETCAPRFSMDRMVKEYVTNYYLPAGITGKAMRKDEYKAARELAAWKGQIRQRWPGVKVSASFSAGSQLMVGDTVEVEASVTLNGVDAASVAVEAVYSLVAEADRPESLHIQPLRFVRAEANHSVYRASIQPADSGRFDVGVRVRPSHPAMINATDTALVTWA